MNEEYQRQRADALLDDRLATITAELKEIQDRLIRLETRVGAGVILATAMITLAAMVAPLIARVILPSQ